MNEATKQQTSEITGRQRASCEMSYRTPRLLTPPLAAHHFTGANGASIKGGTDMDARTQDAGWSEGGTRYRLPSGAVVEADAYGIIEPGRYSAEVVAEFEAIVDAEQSGN